MAKILQANEGSVELIRKDGHVTAKLNGEDVNLDNVTSITVDVEPYGVKVTITTTIFAQSAKIYSDIAIINPVQNDEPIT